MIRFGTLAVVSRAIRVFSVAAATVVVSPQLGVADEGLFSDVRIESVFDSESTDSKSRSSEESDSEKSDRVRNVDHLGRLLRIEGFGFEQVGSRTFGATTEIDDWTFPTLVTLSEDGQRIGLILGLVRYENITELSSKEMLSLLTANQSVAPYQFSFNKKRERTELVLVLKNEEMDSTRLAREINRLKEIGRDTESVWYKEAAENDSQSESKIADASGSDPTPETDSPSERPNSLSAASLIGRWTFSKSATEAFALDMTSANRFKLVQVSAGKTSTSEGTYRVTDGKLVLAVTGGLSLSGPVTMTNASTFEFTPVSGSQPLVFAKAN